MARRLMCLYRIYSRSTGERRLSWACSRPFVQSESLLCTVLGREGIMTTVRESSRPAGFDLGAYFEPYVRQWLIETDNKTTQWVQAVRFHNYLDCTFR